MRKGFKGSRVQRLKVSNLLNVGCESASYENLKEMKKFDSNCSNYFLILSLLVLPFFCSFRDFLFLDNPNSITRYTDE